MLLTDETIRPMLTRYLQGNPDELPAIGTWDVTQVTDMSDLFFQQSTFNEDVRPWNVSNVTNMSGMFQGCMKLNQDLRHWNTEKVVDMKLMFKNTNMPEDYKPHVHALAPPPEQGFDVILLVLLHGATVTSCPTQYKSNFANATLLESTPCGVDSFCDTTKDPSLVMRYIDAQKDNPIFLTDLQRKLRLRKQAIIKAIRDPPPGFDMAMRERVMAKPTYSLFEEQEGWELIDAGYLERIYHPDEMDVSKQTIVVCHSKDDVLRKGENLVESYRITSRTGLMHLLKDSGYGKPLIIDFSCAGFLEPIDDDERRRRIHVGRSLHVTGGRKRRTKRRRRANIY